MAYKNKEDQNAYTRMWYRKNKESVLRRKRERKQEIKAAVRNMKDVPCADCGERYPYYVMDFDHIQGDKIANVATLVNNGNWLQILEEVQKCEIVCANCHRIRTHSVVVYTVK